MRELQTNQDHPPMPDERHFSGGNFKRNTLVSPDRRKSYCDLDGLTRWRFPVMRTVNALSLERLNSSTTGSRSD
jgi:hypothetical protein